MSTSSGKLRAVSPDMPESELRGQLRNLRQAIKAEISKSRPTASIITRLQVIIDDHESELTRRETGKIGAQIESMKNSIEAMLSEQDQRIGQGFDDLLSDMAEIKGVFQTRSPGEAIRYNPSPPPTNGMSSSMNTPSPLLVSKVRILPAMPPNSSYMAIGQIMVISPKGENLALRKPVFATSISPGESKPVEWITDGQRKEPTNKWGEYFLINVYDENGGLVGHEKLANEYVEIDLQGVFPVKEVIYVGGMDNDSRNNGVRVELLDDMGNGIGMSMTTMDAGVQTLDFSNMRMPPRMAESEARVNSGSASSSRPISSILRGLTGAVERSSTNTQSQVASPRVKARYVRVLPGEDRIMAITQIIVNDFEGNNIALGKIVDASSTAPGTSAASITDGSPMEPSSDQNEFWHIGSLEGYQYIQIDLEEDKEIKEVIYVGRDLPGYEARHKNVIFEFYDNSTKLVASTSTDTSGRAKQVLTIGGAKGGRRRRQTRSRRMQGKRRMSRRRLNKRR